MLIQRLSAPRITIYTVNPIAARNRPISVTRFSDQKQVKARTSNISPRRQIQTRAGELHSPRSLIPHKSQFATMATPAEYEITTVNPGDFDEWATLFKAYIAFYKASIPEDQYEKTFKRILDPASDLFAFVMRERQAGSDKSKLVAIAHFFPEQTPWSEQKIMLLNDLFVDPSLRGKGHGRKMIQAVANYSKQLGCLRLQWLTKHDNVTARRLYDTMADASFVQYRMGV